MAPPIFKKPLKIAQPGLIFVCGLLGLTTTGSKRLPVTAEARTNWLTAKQSKFFVDENRGREVTAFLREKKLNVRDVFEEGLVGRSDEDVMAFAWRTRCILLTHDRDFLDDSRFPEDRNPGVIVLPGGDGNQTAMGYGIARVLSSAAARRQHVPWGAVVHNTLHLAHRRRRAAFQKPY
jgi:predicted nuclease of predicted toxin-antitoxin system